MTRSHRLRLAVPTVAGALVMATGLLAACSAGQLAATSRVVPSVPGAHGTVDAGSPTETITVSNATLDFPGPAGYKQRGNAPASLWIFNNTPKDITLDGVESDAGQVVISTGAHAGAPSPCLSSGRAIQVNPSTGAPTAGVGPSAGASGGVSPAGPTSTPSNRPSAKPTASVSPSVSASAPASASPSPSPSPSAQPAGSTDVKVQIKPFGCVVLNRDASQFLQITGLKEAVGSGMTLNLRFHFSQAGATYTIPSPDGWLAVPVNVPASAGSRPPAGETPGE